jgi:hypothetical protein
MGIKGFIVRMLPFVGTFALGLFIASFFVNISSPACSTKRGRFHEMKRLRIDNEELRNENLRLQNEIENLDRNLHDLNKVWEAPPAPKRPAAPPAPPRLSR